MTKYKSDIADSASNMMQLPGTLEGMLQDMDIPLKPSSMLFFTVSYCTTKKNSVNIRLQVSPYYNIGNA